MPTYEYQCTACGHKFEKFQSITADPIKECPECKKKKVKRLIGTGAGIIFKGSGFYITDYRSDSYRSGAKSDSATSPSTSSSSPSSSTPPAKSGSSDSSSSSSSTSTPKSGSSSSGSTPKAAASADK